MIDSDTTQRTHVGRLIDNQMELSAMTIDRLLELSAIHSEEIVSLGGKIDSAWPGAQWVHSAKRALNVINTHYAWIRGEIKKRRREDEAKKYELNRLNREYKSKIEDVKLATIEAKKLRADSHRAEVLRLNELKTERTRITAERSKIETGFFNKLVKELIGADEYVRLWEMAREMAGDLND